MKGDVAVMNLDQNCNSLQVIYLGDRAEIVVSEMSTAVPLADAHKLLEAAGWSLEYETQLGSGGYRIERWQRK